MSNPTTPAWTYAEISDNGERVTHLFPNDCYYAHLSLYYFALQFCQPGGSVILDAGAGAGYGTDYLAAHNAGQVCGCELSEKAVAFSRDHFQRPNLEYRVADLQQLPGFTDQSFDLIFSSNVLEHLPDVMAFLRRAWALLKVEGVMVIAVPPIVNQLDWDRNLYNVYHLNLWSPRQWQQVLASFFTEVQAYWHGFNKPGVPLDFYHTPEQCQVNEKDFFFKPIPVDTFYREDTLTTIFVARRPRAPQAVPALNARPQFVEGSFTRRLHEPQWRFLLRQAESVARFEGVGGMLAKTWGYVRRQLRR